MAKQSFNDFSGGLTDLPFNTASNYAVKIDNFLVNRDKSIEVRNGFDFYSSTNKRSPEGNKRSSNIIDIDNELVVFTNGNAYNLSNGNSLVATPGNKAFHQANNDTMIDVTQYGEQYICTDDSYSFPVKLYKDSTNKMFIVNAGLPKLLSEPNIQDPTSGESNYIYAFCYEHKYNIGSTQFLDVGEPTYLEVTDIEGVDNSDIVIENIAPLTNGSSRNYNLPSIRIQIYRTQSNGTTFYKLGDIINGVFEYTDNTPDEDLESRAILYTQGDILPNELPPQAKYVATSSNVVWYGNITEGAETKPYRLKFSKVGDPDSVPESFFEDFESEIMGLTSVNDRLIVMTKSKLIRLEGVLDDTGRGSIIRNTIADIGCLSNASIVTTQDFAYWFSESGIYKTDGFNHSKLTSHLDMTYQVWTENLSKQRKIFGTYDNVNQRVYWTVSVNEDDNDTIVIYDELSGGFSTWSSEGDMQPSTMIFKDQSLIRLDTDGYIFHHKNDYYSDLKKDYDTSPGEWSQKVIPYEWKHVAWDFGDSDKVKWIPKVSVFGRPSSNVSMEIRAYREGSPSYDRLSPIKFNPLVIWGDPSVLWGDNSVRWNSIDYLNVTKRMNRRSLRSTHMQLAIGPADVKIASSVEDTGSYISVNSNSKVVSLVDPSTYAFPLNLEYNYILINGKDYIIQSGTEDALVLIDTRNSLVDGTYKWEVRGTDKTQRPHISGVSATYEFFGDMDKLSEA